MTAKAERFIPLKEAAPLFGRSYEWLLAQCKGDDAIPHRHIGREYFMTESDIAEAQSRYAAGNRRKRRSLDHLTGRNDGGRRR